MKKLLITLSIILSTSFLGCNKSQNLKNPKEEAKKSNIVSNTKDTKLTTNSNIKKPSLNSKNIKFNNEGIPVIMYHSIKYEKNNCVRLPKEQFKKQMKYLKDNDYTTLTLDELYNFLKTNSPIPKKSVVLTFDDGYKDNYETAFPILKKYGFKGTLFMISNCINTGEYLNIDQLKEMDKNGFDIQSHTENHEVLNKLSYNKQYKTLINSKKNLEKLLNKEIKYIAYPCGKYNNTTVKAVKNAGYLLGVTTDGRWADKSDGIYTLDRVFISGFHNLETFKLRITNPNYNFHK